MRPNFAILLPLILLSTGAGPVNAQKGRVAAEAELLATDARQRDAVANGDLDAIAAISHPDLHVNAPTGTILSKSDLIRMVGSGEIRNEVFERVPESVTITGDVGMVMGSETVRPGTNSEQARQFGTGLLRRRYTNIYLRTGGVWQHWARHANIVR